MIHNDESPEGGSVELNLQHINEKVWVSVIDSGRGISEVDLPRIFERFYRGDSAREGAALNTGIGLSIVHRIVAMHGERVEARNTPTRGALFRFSLSVVDPAGILIAGIEIMHMIRKSQLAHIKDRASSAANQFYSLAF